MPLPARFGLRLPLAARCAGPRDRYPAQLVTFVSSPGAVSLGGSRSRIAYILQGSPAVIDLMWLAFSPSPSSNIDSTTWAAAVLGVVHRFEPSYMCCLDSAKRSPRKEDARRITWEIGPVCETRQPGLDRTKPYHMTVKSFLARREMANDRRSPVRPPPLWARPRETSCPAVPTEA